MLVPSLSHLQKVWNNEFSFDVNCKRLYTLSSPWWRHWLQLFEKMRAAPFFSCDWTVSYMGSLPGVAVA